MCLNLIGGLSSRYQLLLPAHYIVHVRTLLLGTSALEPALYVGNDPSAAQSSSLSFRLLCFYFRRLAVYSH